MPRAAKVWLAQEQQDDLERFARSRTLAVRLVLRAKILLLAAAHKPNEEIARALDITRQTVGLWRGRFAEHGVAGIAKDAPRSGRPRLILPGRIDEIVRKTTRETPPDATHWSTRTLAQATGVGASTVGRIWRAHGLKPHRVKSFKLSNDPRFAEKLEDVVNLYLHPPAGALVLAVDEKCQIQALDRTQPGLPWIKGRCGTMTHDYKRHGTSTLFAAMNTQDGTVIDVCMPQHRHQEWIRFLELIHGRTPQDKQLHLIMDNYSAHKHPKVEKWLARHPRFQVHFTPTSSSWLNMVERFFRDLTVKCIRRGVFHSVSELEQTIQRYIDRHNQKPKPYLWTAKARDVLEKVKRAWAALRARGYVPKNQKFAALQSIDRRLSVEPA
ncbi:MAG: endonuclease DDE [Anaerolineales bacterium]|nr:endonuclease DDE [Anaerolineales bacterium]